MPVGSYVHVTEPILFWGFAAKPYKGRSTEQGTGANDEPHRGNHELSKYIHSWPARESMSSRYPMPGDRRRHRTKYPLLLEIVVRLRVAV